MIRKLHHSVRNFPVLTVEIPQICKVIVVLLSKIIKYFNNGLQVSNLCLLNIRQDLYFVVSNINRTGSVTTPICSFRSFRS